MMRIEGDRIVFEYLMTVDASTVVGSDSPIIAPTPFNSSNAPGEPKDAGGIECMEQMGRSAISNFKKVFAVA
jgi:hypothetical protein